MAHTAEPDDRAFLSTAEVQELDSLGRTTGVEAEALYAYDTSLGDSATEAEGINDPFNPDKIDVVTRTPTVDLLLSRIRNQRIDLEPDFQRTRGIWSTRAKSRLVESLLLRIPLPTLYAAELEDESWAIVDGIQRLAAITEFMEPASLDAPPLVLRDLEYLRQYNGATFADLPVRLQTRLREAELVVHLIRLGTPEPVKFNIFARINTGGLPLSAQELRHALISGPARQYLRHWAESELFREATGGSVRSERMADREMVLRFVAFRLFSPAEYVVSDLDEFLRTAMRQLNELSAGEVAALKQDFDRALSAAIRIFGRQAFRKRSPDYLDKRNPINKAIFEVVMVNLAALPAGELQTLVARSSMVESYFVPLMSDYDFLSAISVGTGQRARVHYRFAAVRDVFAEVLFD